MSENTPYVIVIGNEKGGTGKSTVSMHLIVHLLRLGFKVGTMDLDARQGTLTNYISNRKAFCEREGKDLPMPDHHPILRSTQNSVDVAYAEENARLEACFAKLAYCDFIVIDTPGTDSNLSQIAHSYADTLITPLNDSFIDLDVIAKVNPESREIKGPSHYSEMVWNQKKKRLMRDRGQIDWIVLRNRLSSLYTKSKEEMLELLSSLAQRVGFRLASGFGERVIFRDLFLQGLTLLDMQDVGQQLSLSHVAAKQELRALLEMIKLPTLEERLRMAS